MANKILNEYSDRFLLWKLWCDTHFVMFYGSDIAALSGFEVSVHVMSVCLCSPCAWPVACSWQDEGCGALSLWCSVTAGMGLGLPTWQHAKWVSRSAPTVHLHLCTCSVNPQTNHVRGASTHGSDSTQVVREKEKATIKLQMLLT